MTTVQYVEKLNKLEKELLKLKIEAPIAPKIYISLKGLLKGLKISEKEVQSAKKSLFKKIKI